MEHAPGARRGAAPHEDRVPVAGATLYARDVGRGQPIVVLHGGPDFDHSYLLPDMDRLSESFRLIYYDQRGRGKSAVGVRAEDVTLASDLADMDKVREHFQLGSTAVLGHSWGTVLALEYAIRHPERVSHLILMNPAPASAADYRRFRKERLEKLGADLDRLRAVATTDGYKAGDPDAVAAYYRIHFKAALKRPEDYERLMEALPAARFVTMKECGHFAYLECPGSVRKEIDGLFRHPVAPARPNWASQRSLAAGSR